MTELLSPFTTLHTEFQDKLSTFITEHWVNSSSYHYANLADQNSNQNEVVGSDAFKDVVASLENQYAQGTSALILQILRRLQPPPKR